EWGSSESSPEMSHAPIYHKTDPKPPKFLGFFVYFRTLQESTLVPLYQRGHSVSKDCPLAYVVPTSSQLFVWSASFGADRALSPIPRRMRYRVSHPSQARLPSRALPARSRGRALGRRSRRQHAPR